MPYDLKEGPEHCEGCYEAKRGVAVGSSEPQSTVVCANAFVALVGPEHNHLTVEGTSLQPKVAVEACMNDWIPSRQIKHQRSLAAQVASKCCASTETASVAAPCIIGDKIGCTSFSRTDSQRLLHVLQTGAVTSTVALFFGPNGVWVTIGP